MYPGTPSRFLNTPLHTDLVNLSLLICWLHCLSLSYLIIKRCRRYLPNGSIGLKTDLSGCSVVEWWGNDINGRFSAFSTAAAAAAGFRDRRRSDWSSSYLMTFTPPLLRLISVSGDESSRLVADSARRVKSNRGRSALVVRRLAGWPCSSVAGRSVGARSSSLESRRHRRGPLPFSAELTVSSPRFSRW